MGLGSIIIGGLALSDVSEIDTDNIQPLMDTITLDAIQPLGMVKNFFIGLIIGGVAIIILIVPVVAVVLSDSGIKKYALCMYTTLFLTFILLEIIVAVQWSTTEDTVENKIKSKMDLALNHFKADTTTNSNPISNAWNFLFMTLDCCGVNAVVSTTNDFDATTWCTTSGSCQATSSQIPKTCCLNVDENTYSSAPTACHASVNSGTYNTKGCFDALKETVLYYSSSVIGVACTTVILEIFAFVISVILLKIDSHEVDTSD